MATRLSTATGALRGLGVCERQGRPPDAGRLVSRAGAHTCSPGERARDRCMGGYRNRRHGALDSAELVHLPADRAAGLGTGRSPWIRRGTPESGQWRGGLMHRVLKRRSGLAAIDLGELWASRELLGFLAWRDVAVRYRQTVIGV